MSTNGINEALSAGFKVKLQNRGAKSSGITFELKSVFDEMAKQGLIKDTDGKGLTKQDALNLYEKLNKIHQETKRATNYTTMQVGQEFNYTADEMKDLAKAAGYEIVEKPAEEPRRPEIEPLKPVDTIVAQAEAPELSIKTRPVEHPEVPKTGDDTIAAIPDAEVPAAGEENPASGENTVEEAPMTARERREARREERREERLERSQEKAELKQALAEAVPEFQFRGQTGRIIDGKYYINNREVKQDVFENAKLKAASSQASNRKSGSEKTEVEPFTSEQISEIKVNVPDFEYEIDENGNISHNKDVLSSTDPEKNDLFKKLNNVRIFQDPNTGEYTALDFKSKNLEMLKTSLNFHVQDLSLQQAVYMDLVNKQNSGTELNANEKTFMKNIHIFIQFLDRHFLKQDI